MREALTSEGTILFERRGRGGRSVARSTEGAPVEVAAGRVPRVARLMALAVHFEGLLRSGAVRDYAQLARLAHVTRARISQIMNLRLLATDIQEAVLLLPNVYKGRDPIRLDQLQRIALTVDWTAQRVLWQALGMTSCCLLYTSPSPRD
mgnify:CR=1 FL=1